MATLNFDSSTIEPTTSFDPIPADWYNVQITDSELKPTKNGAGEYLELTLEVLDGEFAGRNLWDRLTLVHTNAQTVEIAQRALSSICHAVGKLRVTDSVELHGLPLRAKVGIEPSEQYGPRNVVKAYAPAVQAAIPPRAPTPARAAAPARKPAASGAVPPWAAKRAG